MSASQWVYYPVKDHSIPSIDLLSLLFDSPLSHSFEHTVLHADAADSSNWLNKTHCRDYTRRIAHGLRARYAIGKNGPGKDVVVSISSGQVMLPCLFWGIIAAGGVYSAAAASFTSGELARQVKQGRSRLIVCSAECRDTALAAAKECGLSEERVLVLESAPERSLKVAQSGEQVIGKVGEELEWERITDQRELDERVICLLYSSGTTGIPKGVNLSHTNIVSEGLIAQLMYREWLHREAERKSWPMEYRTLAHLPAAHIAGVQGYLINPALAGGTVYWMPKFEFNAFLEYNRKYAITFFFTVPPIYLLIAKSDLVTDQFKALRHAISGAAPMGAELTALAEAKLGCYVSQTWGLSETTGSVTAASWDEHDVTGSVSPLMPNTRMRIVDDDDRDIEEGMPGELLMKGPMVTKGYWMNEQATRDSFTTDGWFRTGDIGLRRDGMFYVVDRKKVCLSSNPTCDKASIDHL